MAKLDSSQKHILMCVRLAAECNNLAGDAAMPNHARCDYIRMASMWMKLALQPPQDSGRDRAEN
jgi:hypothetical protein